MKKDSAQRKTGFARLMELAGQKRRKLIVACSLSVLSSAARMVPFFTIYSVISILIMSRFDLSAISRAQIGVPAGITLASALVYGICAYISSALAHTAAYDVIYELRIRLMDKLAKLPSGYFTATTQGSIKKIMSDDTEQIEVFIAHHLCDIAAAVATPVFTLLYLFCMDWRLALVVLLPILISFLLLGICLARPDKAALQTEMHDAQEAMQGTIVEYIHGMAVIKIFNRSLSAFRRYEGDITRFVNAVKKTAKANAWPMAAYYAFFGAQLLFLLPAGVLLLLRAEDYAGFLPVVFLFFLVGSGLKEPIENMMQMVIVSGKIIEGVSRMDGILLAEEISEGTGAAPQEYSVSFEDVSFSYVDGVKAVDHVSFTMRQGSVTGLVGPSGGGKSTLARLLLRFYETGEGCIRIGGVDIRDIPQEQLTHIVSYVFQENFLFHDTVENNIRMGDRSATMEQVREAAENAGIHDVIMRLPRGYQM
ncbi:ABC transporter transmembrane region [Marvinbryantia formatexigens DSM 14469]|uniref:ABC transporter transmembrane region n=1 Tax=Marvinbryantia formatexigens DSM 14469 TaxID=478749 RepID=C6LJ52_9FIRM|nr:ABC transporter ATP-binding protein [Marvinbryantia formatexigens]EET59372.1 ABC transporter transmembrane region [Marvinbryantia formatexigens DSM 14469]UWO24363.1 ABC transporter ATP-binding protein/permease [Marvinbryantia formatexigens DSM 14469]SDF52112.1 ATP-binding cassette, subfamily B [Marvinbryantia formatexigens]